MLAGDLISTKNLPQILKIFNMSVLRFILIRHGSNPSPMNFAIFVDR